AGRELVALSTPGHASHHHTFWDPAGRIAYTGDVAGTRLPDFYLPLAAVVPPEFDVEAVEASLDRIRALNPAVLCLAHATAVRDVDRHLDILGRQLRDWEELIEGYVAAGLSEVEMADRLRAINQRNEDGTPLDPHTARLQEIQSPAAFAVAGYLRYFQTRARREAAG
ncbi:MAG: MBL fold metallo-hydrolase, partial [Chloroflexi bacterium]|nr:MBL fold metallo-hydrolase [Chloroflexota bacterium]